MLSSLKLKVINYVFVISKQPILLRDLLISNSQYIQKLHVDPIKLGFRLREKRAYFIYTLLVILFLTSFTIITHKIFENLDPHISIVVAMVLTSIVFIFFTFFKLWLIDEVALNQIRKSWELHFPFFPYGEYSKKINEIYEKANKLELPKKDLEKYILDNLTS